jgi:serine/threonine protein phosphatase PrpC
MGTYISIALALAALGALLYYFFASGPAEKPALQPPGNRPADRPATEPGAAAPGAPEPIAIPAGTPAAKPGTAVDSPGKGVAQPPAYEAEADVSRPNPLILVNALGRTDPGLKRKHNEDSYLVLESHDVFMVADGMGRHAAGEVASQLAVETVTRTFEQAAFESRPRVDESREAHRLRCAALDANDAVFTRSQEVDQYHGMGTTMVAMHFSRGRERAAILHAGDSRCYRLRGGELVQLTTDHTLGAAGIAGGNSTMLSRAVGIEPALDPDVLLERPQPDDVYLLCSDGLSRMVPEEQMLPLLTASRDLDQVSAKLIEVANAAGGRDNVTVILVRVERASLSAAL